MKFIPLESNPEMLTAFVRELGIPPPARFVDIWSFDADALAFFPRPVLALCVLYPSEKVDVVRRHLYANKMLPDAGVAGLVYCRQNMSEHGNACGSIAVVHALCNNPQVLEGPLREFRAANVRKSAEEAGRALGASHALQHATAQSASLGQTATPDREDEVPSHFVVFLVHDGRLLELDGLLRGPVDHGACAQDSLLESAARVVREVMMPADPGNLGFTAIALTTGEQAE
jgi:ubiquitin carboxyl-terminal hydrolase L3